MKNPKQLTRFEKIQFLTDLKNGIVSVNEIIPQRVETWITIKEGYMNNKTKEVINPVQFDLVKKRIADASGLLLILEKGKSLSIFGTRKPSGPFDEDTVLVFLEAINNGYKIEQFKKN
ncbi:MAG: hypothetical protein ABI359_07075 [Ginsengibacter sp.]